MIKKRILISAGCLILCAGLNFVSYGAAHSRTTGRFTIVVAVKHAQFSGLYDYLRHHARNFDPRYAGSLRTDGRQTDEHKNLHITLASTAFGEHNEQACMRALNSIAGSLSGEIHLTFDSRHVGLDNDRHVTLKLNQDGGYRQLVALRDRVLHLLRQQGATGIHEKNPNHITIGFATALPRSRYNGHIGYGRATHARVYHWRGHGDQAHPPREEFYPKAEVQIHR